MYKNFQKNWIGFLEEGNNKYRFISIFLILLIVLFFYSKFLVMVEARPGVVIDDPILDLLPAFDLTWLIFGILYVAVISSILGMIGKPKILMTGMLAYFILILLRMLAMYLTPLEPPDGMIILKDPIVEFFGTGKTLTKDLFFSGHTSLMFILLLVQETKFRKGLLLIGTVIVAEGLILQHVHFSIDVLVAPFFSYVSFIIAKKTISSR